ncbi:hypothetical protein Tco_1064022 [Tanacetum coccineum]
MFGHYVRDEFMFTAIRVISKHKDTQEYGAILPPHLTNQAMLESEAFKTYRAYATSEKAPKSKATKKKTNSESSLKTKPSQASKGDGVNILSKVPDAQQQIRSGTNEGAGDKLEFPNVPKYRSEGEEESWTFSQGVDEEEDEEHDSDVDNDDEDDNQENDSQRTESDDEGDDFVHLNLSTYIANDQEKEKEEEKADDDDDALTSDQKVSTPPDYELIEEDENQKDDDTMGKDQEDEEHGELYRDLNLNLDRQDAKMTDAQTNQETEEAHIPNFASLFGFERRVSLLESDLSELKQTNQFAEALSSILDIVDKYLAAKVKDTLDVAVQLKSDKLREEAQAENQDFLNSLDSNMKRTIKEQVKAQTSKIMTKVEKYVTKTLGAEVLVRSTNQPQTSDVQKNLYRALLKAYNSDKDLLSSYGEVVILKRGCDDQDKEEEPSARSNRGSPPKSSGKSVQEKEHDPRVDDLEEPFHQEFDTGNDDVSPVKEAIDIDERLWNPSSSRTHDREWNQTNTGKLTNLNVDERFALNVALRMYTRRIVFKERAEDLQLAVESYQKKINLTKPDTYHSDISKKTPYTAYRDIQIIIYQDDMDRNR